jgi:hypothetical protein
MGAWGTGLYEDVIDDYSNDDNWKKYKNLMIINR